MKYILAIVLFSTISLICCTTKHHDSASQVDDNSESTPNERAIHDDVIICKDKAPSEEIHQTNIADFAEKNLIHMDNQPMVDTIINDYYIAYATTESLDSEDYIGPFNIPTINDSGDIVDIPHYYYGSNAIIVLGYNNETNNNDTLQISRSLIGDSLQIKKAPEFGLCGIGKLWLEDMNEGMINFRLLFLKPESDVGWDLRLRLRKDRIGTTMSIEEIPEIWDED